MSEFIEIPATKRSLTKRKPVQGVGINDARYLITQKINGKYLFCPYYRVWADMIKRCYSQKFQKKCPTYADCSVTKEWLTFSNFKTWMVKQDWAANALDKDVLVPGNKIYSPNTCAFISLEINNLLLNNASSRGFLPQGVCFDKQTGRYRSFCGVGRKNKHLGRFTTIIEAEAAYLEFKIDRMIEIANNQASSIKRGLMKHVLIMENRLAELGNYNYSSAGEVK